MAAGLTGSQRVSLDGSLPGWRLVEDMSWGLVGTTVLRVEHHGAAYVVKAAAGPGPERHLARELRAHRDWLAPWTRRGRAPRLVHADEDAHLLVHRYLPGELVQGSAAEAEPDTYRQAGRLLRLLHDQHAEVDDSWEARARDRTLAWLARPHRIDPAVAERLREEIDGWPAPPVAVVPTHGDWQPRNWLVHERVVSAIDFGRADLRPAWTDLTRLAAQQLHDEPTLEAAFLDGYGADPRQPASWRRERVREAVATAVWAREVGDERFEEQGHRMIADVAVEGWAQEGR